jgi:methyl-accepting chemotaxis protein
MKKLSVYQQLSLICIVAMLGLIVLGEVSKLQIKRVFDSSTASVVKTTPTYIQFFEINKNLNAIVQRSLVHMIASDEDSMMELQLEIDDAKEKLQISIDKLSKDACGGKSCIQNEDEQRRLTLIKSELSNYEKIRVHAFELAQQKNHIEAEQVLENELMPALDSLQDAIQSEIIYNEKLAKEGMEKAALEKNASEKFSMIVAIISLGLLFLISHFVFKSLKLQLGLEPRKLTELAKEFANGNLSSPIALSKSDNTSVAYSIKSLQDTLKEIVQELNKVSGHHESGDVDAVIDDKRFKGSYGDMARGINRMVKMHVNSTKEVVSVADAFGKGNFDAPLAAFPGEQAYINVTIEKVRSNIKDFIVDMNFMSKEHEVGNNDVFINEDKFNGAYKEMALGLNSMVKGHLEVSDKAMTVVKAFGDGDFSVQIEDLPGKKAEIKSTIESVRHNIQSFIVDMNMMSHSHDLGDIDAKIDTNRFNGAYKKMAEGVNNMVAGHIDLTKKAIQVVEAFGEGDFNQNLEQFPGKKAFINQAIEQVRSNLQMLSEDAIMLSTAAENGEIDMRANAERHRGDFRKIIEGVNTTLDIIVEPILVVKDAVYAINSAAQEISNGNNDLSVRTEKQASSLEETTVSIEELTSKVNENSNNAKQATFLANEASRFATNGGQSVGEIIHMMSSLNESAKKIEEITSVIDSIAFQTNILALNAAVEAARAGEQGRGFAVVAGEVRNLALRSAEAAKEIKSLINESVSQTFVGAAQVQAAGKTMTEIVNSVQKVNEIIDAIAHATSEQSAGIRQVNEAINQIDEVTQQNSALVEEAAAAAESLAEQSLNLSDAVSAFKLTRNSINSSDNSHFIKSNTSVNQQDYFAVA